MFNDVKLFSKKNIQKNEFTQDYLEYNMGIYSNFNT